MMETLMDSKAKIIESAIDAFAKYGFTGCSTAQIAENAGVSEALLFSTLNQRKSYWMQSSLKLSPNAFQSFYTKRPINCMLSPLQMNH